MRRSLPAFAVAAAFPALAQETVVVTATRLPQAGFDLPAAIDAIAQREFVRVDNVTGRRYAGSVIVAEGNNRFFEPAPGRNWFAGVEVSRTF